MARKKVNLAWISNDKARRATFKKRKKGLMKKVSELSTLCGVGACAVVYGPYNPQPEIWPENFPEAQQVLSRFKSLPEMEQCRKMMNQEAFLRQRVGKLREQLKRQLKENREMEMASMLAQSLEGKGLEGVRVGDLSELACLVEAKMKVVRERIEVVRASMERRVEGNEMGLEMAMEVLQREQWFMEVMNSNEFLGCGGGGIGEMGLQFGDNNHPWLDPYFASDS